MAALGCSKTNCLLLPPSSWEEVGQDVFHCLTASVWACFGTDCEGSLAEVD